MKMLLSTTALVVAISFPTVMAAQTTAAQTDPAATQQQVEMPGFLSSRGESDMLASELIGQDVYARRSEAGAAVTTGAATTGLAATDQPVTGQATGAQDTQARAAVNSDGTDNQSMITRADLDTMDNIGQITDVVLSSDGQVRALVVGVGGFLGMGERDAAVTMDQITFAADQDNQGEMFVVVNTDSMMLKESPAYDRSAMATDRTMPTEGVQQGTERMAFTAPAMQRDGYTNVEVTEITAEMLVGKTVYGVSEDSVGEIDDLILDDKGAITNVIIDFGGFLGMGTSQVSVGYDELTIIADEGRSDVRVYVDATKDQIQAQPQYRAGN